jgi:flagellar basal body-associated protein FliL
MSNQPPNNEPWQSPPPYQNGGLPPSPPQWQQPPYQQSQQPPNTYYPQQPYQQPYQPMPPKKKSRLWLWIVLAVVAVLLFGCIGVFALISNAAKNTSTVTVPSGNTPVPSTQHFTVGQIVKIDDTWDVTLNSVKTSSGDQYSAPKSGNTYLIIDLTMKNISSQEQNVSSLISFDLKDSTGQKYTETITTMSDIHPPDGKVEAGAPLRGQLVYEVPTSIKDYTLSFQADFTSSGQTIWDIHM